MNADIAVTAPLRTIVICHQESLLAAATGAMLEDRHVAQVAAVVTSLTQLLTKLRSGVDIAVLFEGPDDDVIDLFEALHHRGVTVPVLVVSVSVDPAYLAVVLEAGAAGIVRASCGASEFCESIADSLAGQIVVPAILRPQVLDALRQRRVDRFEAQQQLAHISALDLRILQNLCDGMTVARISERLLLSTHTIRGHVRTIGLSLGTHGQLGIAASGRRLLAQAQLPAGIGGRAGIG